MKKVISFMLSVMLAASIFTSVPVSAEALRYDDFEYEIYEDDGIESIEITNYTGSDADVVVPDKIDGKKVLYIGSDAFLECENLKTLTISEGVKSIDMYAVTSCDNLEKVNIPSSLEYFSYDSFWRCIALKEISIDSENEEYCSVDGVVFSKDMKSLITYAAGKTDEKYEIPKGVKEIFSLGRGSKFKEIIIPDTVDYIANGAFGECKNLESVEIPSGVSLGSYAFEECVSLKSVKLPSELKALPSYIFMDCTNLEEVIGISNITDFGGYCFWNCEKFTNLNLSENVAKIDNDCFENTGYYNNESNWKDGVLYYNNYLLNVDYKYKGSLSVKEGTKIIAGSACRECYDITEYNIPDGVTYVGSKAFINVKNAQVTVPASVKYIGDYAFGFKENDSDEEEKIDGFKILGYTNSSADAYARRVGLTFESIGEVEPEANPEDWSYDVNEDGTLYLNEYKGEDAFVVIPDEIDGKKVTELGCDLFNQRDDIIDVKIPDTVKLIDPYAFYESGIREITIPDSVVEIHYSAFSGCRNLSSVKLSENLEILGRDVFEDTPLIENEDNWKDDIFYIDNVLVKAKDSISGSLEINGDVRLIAEEAFKECNNLTEVKLPEGIKVIADSAFESCENLSSVSIPESVKKISYSAFDWCGELKDVYYAGSSKDWDDIEIYGENDMLNEAKIHFAKDSSDENPTSSPVNEPTEPSPTNPIVTEPPVTNPVVTEPKQPNPSKPSITSKKDNPIKVTAKTKTVKAKKLKKKAQTVKAITVKNNKGKVTYKLVKSGITKKIRNLVKINSKGVITIKKWKKAKKGTYKIKVKITAAGNSAYNAKTITKTLKVKIK